MAIPEMVLNPNPSSLLINKSIPVKRLKKPFPNGRGRINCTMAARNDRWRWLGRQFIVK